MTRVTVVIVTRNRCAELLATLDRLRALPEHPPVIVVDNGSADATVRAVEARRGDRVIGASPSDDVVLIRLDRDWGAAARNVGVAHARTPYVAFCDDDSWWEPGSLARAVALLDAHPRVALLAGRVHVGPEGRLDHACAQMRASPIKRREPLGIPVLGFLACAAIVRSQPFRSVGGFHAKLGIGGEEQLLAVDLATAGWQVRYVDELLVHHHPSPQRNPTKRRVVMVRNALWFSWLRRPVRPALALTARMLCQAAIDSSHRAGLLAALRGLPWVLRSRRPLPRAIEADLRLLGR